MKTLIVLMFLVPSIAYACNISEYLIGKWVKRGDIVITYKPTGEVQEVTCDTAKLSPHICQHRIEQIFAFYKK